MCARAHVCVGGGVYEGGERVFDSMVYRCGEDAPRRPDTDKNDDAAERLPDLISQQQP